VTKLKDATCCKSVVLSLLQGAYSHCNAEALMNSDQMYFYAWGWGQEIVQLLLLQLGCVVMAIMEFLVWSSTIALFSPMSFSGHPLMHLRLLTAPSRWCNCTKALTQIATILDLCKHSVTCGASMSTCDQDPRAWNVIWGLKSLWMTTWSSEQLDVINYMLRFVSKLEKLTALKSVE